MTPETADSLVDSAAAYVHIPFCSAVCPYCDFAVVAGRDNEANRYVAAVQSEIGSADSWRSLEAVYLGGGTPSHVDPSLLGQILDALANNHGISNNAEISLEANPEDFTQSKARALFRLGFNRVSFGAQSYDREVLISLGRRHRPHQIETAVRTAREAGFENVSVDLIYGSLGETSQSWRQSLESATDCELNHMSCYALTVEPGTELWRAVSAGVPSPDPDIQADRFDVATDVLEMARYEVSNWARKGYECRYNMTVWAQGEYEAYGNGAHGFRHGARFRNARRLDTYLERVERGESPRVGSEPLGQWALELDRVFVGIRRVVGVADGPGTRALVDSDDGRRLLLAGVIEKSDGRLRILQPMLTDAVCRSVLDLKPPIVSV